MMYDREPLGIVGAGTTNKGVYGNRDVCLERHLPRVPRYWRLSGTWPEAATQLYESAQPVVVLFWTQSEPHQRVESSSPFAR